MGFAAGDECNLSPVSAGARHSKHYPGNHSDLDQITLGGFTISNQSIGVASTFSGVTWGCDGILGTPSISFQASDTKHSM